MKVARFSAWRAINGWRCGRWTNPPVSGEDAQNYKMNCWDGTTRVVFED